MAGVWLFTDNTDFVGGRIRQQDPIAATQVHVTFKFTRSMWLAADANYFTGGQTTIGGTAEPRPPAQFTNRCYIFVGAQARSGDPHVSKPRRLHDDRRRLHINRGQLQLCLGAVKRAQRMINACLICVGLLVVAAATACSGQQETAPAATTSAAADRRQHRPPPTAIPPTVSPYDALPEAVRVAMDKPFTGDFDAMVKRRAIRVAVTFNRTHYFVDRGQELGVDLRVAEALREGTERGPEDGQPQSARRDRADDARSAVSRTHQRQSRHGRCHGDRHARTRETRFFL